jgi:hypothetical protein
MYNTDACLCDMCCYFGVMLRTSLQNQMGELSKSKAGRVLLSRVTAVLAAAAAVDKTFGQYCDAPDAVP